LASATHFCARLLRNIPAAILKPKAGNFCRLVDIAADHHNIAVWRNGANDLFVPQRKSAIASSRPVCTAGAAAAGNLPNLPPD
jgi:hypothetical protein